MNVGMFGIEVFCRNPIELGSKIFLHSLHQIACQPLQIGSVSELGRDNHLPESLVFCLLPFFQSSGNIDALISGGESNQSRILLLGSTLPRQVPAVCLPLSTRLVGEIGNSDGTALSVWTSGSPFSARCAAVASFPAAPCIVHEQFESAGPNSTLTPGRMRLPRAQPKPALVVSFCHGQ